MEKRRFFLVFGSYILFILIHIGFGQAYLGTNDDVYLQTFLYHGDNRTYIMSFPLSTLLAKLYTYFPDAQWFSICMTLTLILIAAVISLFITRIRHSGLKLLLYVLGLVYLRFLVTNISVTAITVTFVALAIPFIRERHKLFWLLILTASLFRFNIILGLLPLIALPYLIFLQKESFEKKGLPALILLWSLLLATLMSNRFYDPQYREWLQFRNAHQYFIDLHGKGHLENFTENEKRILRSWMIQDENILPSKKVIEAADNRYLVMFDNFKKLTPGKIASILYHNKILLILLFLSFWLLAEKKTGRKKKILLTFFILGFFALLFVRNVERVTIPAALMWMTVVTLILLELNRFNRLKFLFGGAIVAFLIDLPLYNSLHTPRHLAWEAEKLELMRRNPLLYETAIYFPTNYTPEYIWSTILHNRLFEEQKWFTRYILPADWVSRHPLFYKLHDISHGDERRKYKNFHDYLISPQTAFIGGKEINEKFNKVLLSEYDKKFLKDTKCHHEIRFLDTSENYAISQVFLVCNDIKR